MKAAARVSTVINYVFSSILWLLGILTFAFNLFGLWAPWHLAGFGFVFYIPVPIIPLIVAIVLSFMAKDIKTIILNLGSVVVSVFFALFTVFVSAGWFW